MTKRPSDELQNSLSQIGIRCAQFFYPMRSIPYYLAILLATLSATAYQVVQKSVPSGAHPLLTVAAAYLIGALVCILLLLFFPLSQGLYVALRQLDWTTLALAVTIIGIEVGYLLAYRAGWNIGVASLISNSTVAMLLIPVSLFWFRETLSVRQIVGIGLCLVGLVLINKR